jgi:hypothetical protein
VSVKNKRVTWRIPFHAILIRMGLEYYVVLYYPDRSYASLCFFSKLFFHSRIPWHTAKYVSKEIHLIVCHERNYGKKFYLYSGKEGFEPPTPWFVATCSSPLSYKPCSLFKKYTLYKNQMQFLFVSCKQQLTNRNCIENLSLQEKNAI